MRIFEVQLFKGGTAVKSLPFAANRFNEYRKIRHMIKIKQINIKNKK